MTEILIEKGNLTEYDVDAIVNAANNDLILGGGVAGAIARAGGPEIQAECDRQGPIKVGEAAISTGGNLPAKYVIHAASMRLGGRTTAESLAESVRASLAIAEEHGVRSLAFPAIGTGIAGFPMTECARIMETILLEYSKKNRKIEKIFIVLYDLNAYNVFRSEFEKLISPCKGKK